MEYVAAAEVAYLGSRRGDNLPVEHLAESEARFFSVLDRLLINAERRARSSLALFWPARWMLAAACCLVVLLVPAGASAQSAKAALNVPPRSTVKDAARVHLERDILFKQMMRDPSNLEVAFRYADLSSQAGDLEAAISTLERMLIFAPEETRLKVELGVLYFRLGSYKQALTYFENASATGDASSAEMKKIALYVAAARKKTEINSLHGSVTLGARYQSNASQGPDRIVNRFGQRIRFIDDGIVGEADGNAFISGHFHFRHEFATQGDAFDVDLVTYGSFYARQHKLDMAFAELTFGPDFSLGRFGIDNANLSVYGILGGVAFQGATYRRSAGIGVRLGKVFDAENRGEIRFEYRYQTYESSSLRRFAADNTGDRYDLYGIFQHAFNDRLTVFGTLNAARRNARYDYSSMWEYGGSAGVRYAFDSLIPAISGRWTAIVSAGVLRRDYDHYYPHSDPFQHDTEVFVEGSLSVPVSPNWSVDTAVGYRDVSSNNGVYAYRDASLSIGVVRSF